MGNKYRKPWSSKKNGGRKRKEETEETVSLES